MNLAILVATRDVLGQNRTRTSLGNPYFELKFSCNGFFLFTFRFHSGEDTKSLAVVVTQMVERSLPTSKIRGLGPIHSADLA